MAINKRRKAFMVGILIAVLLTAGASFLVQSGNLFQKQSAPLPEKEKEESSQNKLATVLSTVGLRVGTSIDSPGSYRELKLSWGSLQKPNASGLVSEQEGASAGSLKKLSSTARRGSLPRERSIELSPDSLLVIGVDENETARWWRVMIDPRLVRAEVGTTSDMRSQNLYLANVDFIVGCPDDPQLRELRFFHPVWNGESFRLELVGTTPLN